MYAFNILIHLFYDFHGKFSISKVLICILFQGESEKVYVLYSFKLGNGLEEGGGGVEGFFSLKMGC